jgi:hypothetical protein
MLRLYVQRLSGGVQAHLDYSRLAVLAAMIQIQVLWDGTP